MLTLLITTLIKRPYVFLFLAAFLYLSIKHQGLFKTMIWLFVGYAIAFISEYSSINNGFPYGEYHYIYENLKGELIFAGVPVWDSLSYSFMTYAGYALANFTLPHAKTWQLWLGGTTLTTLLDVITDPVAKLGKDWFLGEIYYYAGDGIYFNVPWTNFAGWFIVSTAIIGTCLFIFQQVDLGKNKQSPSWLHVVFYISICLFNALIALYIQAYLLGVVDLILSALILFGIITLKKIRLHQQKHPIAFHQSFE